MQNSIISFTIILVVFLSSLISFVSTKAISLTEIIVTNQVESLKPEQGTKQLRIVDHDGLILVPKVKVVKTEIEIAKPAVKEVMKMAKTEEKKVDEKSAVKTEIKPDVKTLIKAENIKKTDLNLVSKVENNPKVETPTAIKPQVKTAPKEEAKEVPEVRD